MEKKKIVFTVTNDLTYDQRMQKICTSLAEEGYQVLLVGRKLSHSIPFYFEKVNYKRIRCFWNEGFFFYAEYNLRLLLFLLTNKFDIYSSVDLDTIIPSTIAARFHKSKLVFDAHEYFTQVPEVVNRKRVQKIWAWIERIFVPKADLCYTVGEELALNFQNRLGCKFYVIKNTPHLETDIQNQKISVPERKFILYQGALNKARGIENMILAMKNIDLEFHIVGEGDLSDVLKKLVLDNKLESKVKFLGFMKPFKLREYSKLAYLGLNVSENVGLSYFYSLNNKFFDYVHALLPSLINKFPEYEKLNSQFQVGVLTDSTPSDIENQIRNLLNNPDLYITLKNNCLLAAREWNWKIEKTKLCNLYAKL